MSMARDDFQHHAHLSIVSTEPHAAGSGRRDRTENYILQGTPEQIADKVREWAEASMGYNSRVTALTFRPVHPIHVVDLGEDR